MIQTCFRGRSTERMRIVPAYIFLLVMFGLHQKGTGLDVVSSLKVSTGSGGGITLDDRSLQVCPGTTVNLTCSHNRTSGLTRWEIGAPIGCTAVAIHTNPSDTVCGTFIINMVSAINQPTRMSTLVLPVDQSLNGSVVTCIAGGESSDPQAGNLTLQVIGPPSTPNVDSMEYSVVNSTNGQFRFLASSSGTFGTEVNISASVVEGSVEVVGDVFNVTGLSYNESHTVRVVATSAVCPGVDNSSVDVPVVFNIKSPVLTQLTGFVDCSNSSLPIRGAWSLIDEVQSSGDPATQLTPPLNAVPIITYTSAGGLSGSAVFVPDSSYLLTDTVENDVYTFTVSVSNAAGPSSSVLSDFRVTVLSIDDSTVATRGCLQVNRGPACMESASNGNFAVMLVYGVGMGTCDDKTVNGTINECIPVDTMSAVDFCFTATLFYNGVEIQTLSDTDFLPCQISALKAMLNSGVTVEPVSGEVGHLVSATLVCSSAVFMLTGPSQVQCSNGMWRPNGSSSCSIAIWIVILIVILVFAVGVVLGVVIAATCLKNLVAALLDRRCWAIIVVLCLCILGVGFGILMYTCYSSCKDTQKKKSMTSDEDGLTQSTSSPPPPTDSLYADPKSIEHEAAPGTEDQYAMVDRKVKKNTKPKPTPPEALYQDPNTIEHETAASGDTYAVVDKPKRSSKKKGGPDVVPPASEGLTYADIDLSSKRPKPGSGRQAPQQPGEYPKEHPVEYSSVDHGNTSQL